MFFSAGNSWLSWWPSSRPPRARSNSCWMSELTWKSLLDLDIKLALEDVLSTLNIPHKTMLVDSNVWQTMSNWANVQCSNQFEENSLQNIKKDVKQDMSAEKLVTTSPTTSNNFVAHPNKICELGSAQSRVSNKEHCLSTALRQSLANNKFPNNKKNLDEKSIVTSESSDKGQDIAHILSSQNVE